MTVIVAQNAEHDLIKGYRFYEKQEVGKGEYFLRRLREDLGALQKEAGLHRHILGFYKAKSKRFPHLLFYRISGGVVKVHAILDGRRRPNWIDRQLRRRASLE